MSEKNKIYAGMIFICCILKLLLIRYGIPFHFHPDEIGILKDPVKLLLKYKNADFSSPTSLYNWVSAAWDIVIFGAGYLAGKWNSINEFQVAFVGENIFILIMARFLSLILSITGQAIFLNLGKQIINNKILYICYSLVIIFNPIELISDVWIKFDPLCYLFHALVIYYFYNHFVTGKIKSRTTLYLLCFLALSLRIEFIAYLGCILCHELVSRDVPARQIITKIVLPFAKGLLLYCCITLYPVTLAYKHFAERPTINMSTQKPYEEVIFSRLLTVIEEGQLLNHIGQNSYTYLFSYLFIVIGPLVCMGSILLLYREKSFRVFILLIVFLLFPVLLYVVATPHYILGLSAIIILLGFIYFDMRLNNKLKHVIAILSSIYVISLGSQVALLANDSSNEPRLKGRLYLLSHTAAKDTIAIENYMNPGLSPPIEECPDVLLEKSLMVRKYNIGTGETYKLKAQVHNSECRNVLEIQAEDRFFTTPFKGKWVNTFDTLTFPMKNISFFVSMTNYSDSWRSDDFSIFIKNNFIAVQKYKMHFADLRLHALLPNEGFFFPAYLYSSRHRNTPH